MSQMQTNLQRVSLQQSLCDNAKSFIGTPWIHQARTPHVGLDCIGLVTESIKASGIDLPDLPLDYSRVPKPKTIYSYVNQYCEEITELEPGAIIVMALRKFPQHLGLYLGDNQIIHSYLAAGKVVQHELTPSFKNKICSIHRLKDGFII